MTDGPSAIALVLAGGVPLALSLLWALPSLRPRIGQLAPWAAVPALLLSLFGTPGATLDLSWLLFGARLGLTPTTQVFLFLTALIWTAAGIHWRAHRGSGDHCERFCALWLLTLTGNLGLILALDVALFYTSFALMTFAAYGLIVHGGSDAARRAGRVYLVLGVIGESLILVGLLLAARATETPLVPMLADLPQAIAESSHRDLIIASLWLGFGVKAGLPLLHFSLPLAYADSPLPVAAALAGAMIKAGLLGWLVTLPLGGETLQGWGWLLMGTGLFAAYAGALVGVHQRQPRLVLAYSSISQMGLISVAIGAWMFEPELGPVMLAAVTVYALHHALAKGALFLGTGVAAHRARAPRMLWAALALPALALVGLMPSGLLAKGSLKNLADAGASLLAAFPQLPTLLALAAVGTTVLMARHLWLLRLEAGRDVAPPWGWFGWSLLTAASLFAVFLLPVWEIEGHWPDDAKSLLGIVWPVLLGVTLSLAAWRWLRPWPIPPGDALVLLTPLPELALRAGRALGVTGPAARQLLRHWQARLLTHYMSADHRFGRFTEQLWRRDAALLFALLLALVAGVGALRMAP